jgi:hypothetical protein
VETSVTVHISLTFIVIIYVIICVYVSVGFQLMLQNLAASKKPFAPSISCFSFLGWSEFQYTNNMTAFLYVLSPSLELDMMSDRYSDIGHDMKILNNQSPITIGHELTSRRSYGQHRSSKWELNQIFVICLKTFTVTEVSEVFCSRQLHWEIYKIWCLADRLSLHHQGSNMSRITTLMMETESVSESQIL